MPAFVQFANAAPKPRIAVQPVTSISAPASLASAAAATASNSRAASSISSLASSLPASAVAASSVLIGSASLLASMSSQQVPVLNLPTHHQRNGMAVSASGQGGQGTSDIARPSLSSAWAILGVVAMLANGMKRLLPVAFQPFADGLDYGGWTAYALSAFFFAYVEGYRGFQMRFSPLVVRRALLLGEAPLLHKLLGPVYAMGLVHATSRRRGTSMSLMFVVFCLVAIVKRLPYPYRSILDIGVCVGLSWGMGSVLLLYLRSLLTGKAPPVDPCLPPASKAAAGF
mmetsp:Transcript_87240/g.182580  ORF Transcript_87240/g.182580 Transcript_87240/m.182580 type:complete len:285 (-) Transcript_87240:79-933(-)|eukprot:CAMPEP_0206495814 /NCGR_PEP_ID=MMETSP0324_2-20121206/48889_1 /ASSEMBLY_ACC=CAM_ASM_000836 /TAXON_ID=2866 /ORGANISM="Crypthecodinium cohnii, Strain Seligo" /LENGTH=284 /DNA_ID=CAMNT_0053980415 /DNA_START=101 /DNA_END=955 /DNA_ORIENTATION=+